MSTLRSDPEFLAVVAPLMEGRPAPTPSPSPEVWAGNLNALMGMFIGTDMAEGVTATKFEAPSPEGHTLSLTRFTLASHDNPPEPQPAVLAFFSGAMIAGSVDLFGPHYARIVKASGIQIWAVDYRLAPAHPSPAQTNDGYTALAWLSTNGAQYGVDAARLAVYGESAGGGVAIGTALKARDEGLSPPLKQVMAIYPMIDDRTTEKYKGDWPMAPYSNILREDNSMAWDAYLGPGKRGGEDVSLYAAPGRALAKDLEGYPRTFLDVGGLDLYRDEVLRFGRELAEACVEVQLHLWPGAPHGWDQAAPGTSMGKVGWELRYKCMRDLLSEKSMPVAGNAAVDRAYPSTSRLRPPFTHYLVPSLSDPRFNGKGQTAIPKAKL